MYKLVRNFLFLLPPEAAHSLAKLYLQCLNLFKSKQTNNKTNQSSPELVIKNIVFKNPVGMAAGFDKEGRLINAMEGLGIGFMEVGSFTPLPQKGNPKPRLFRVTKLQALINRMGLNNVGFEKALENIRGQTHSIPLGVSIAKGNQSSAAEALNDYILGLETFYETADYLTINLSCPNVPGHNFFWGSKDMHTMLKAIKNKQRALTKDLGIYRPIFIKISPDMTDNELLEFVNVFNEIKLDGVVAGNTSQWRPENKACKSILQQKGGLSGVPLYSKMLHTVGFLKQHLHHDSIIIAVGGINSAEKAKECLQKGASLVQIYTGLIYEGPKLIRDIVKLCH